MLAKLRPRSAYDVMAALSLFLVLTGGAAYASHETIFSNDIVDGEVKNPDLGADSVSSAKIQTQGVTTGDLAPNSVTASRIPAEAVGTSEIAQGNVFNADLAPNSITETRIDADAVGSSELQNDSVNTSELVNGGIQPADLSADALGARAYGHVNAGGGLSMGRNAEANKPGAAPIYCVATTVTGVDSTNTPIILSTTGGTSIGTATIHATDSINDDPLTGDFIEHSFAEWDGSNEVCPFGWYEVRTFHQFASAAGDQLTVGGADKSFAFVIP